MSISFLSFYLSGWVGSLLLQGGFSRCHGQELSSSFSARASHCDAFSCGTWALSRVVACGLQSTGSGVVAHGLSCCMACGIFQEQGWNLCLLHWQADPLPVSHWKLKVKVTQMCLTLWDSMDCPWNSPGHNIGVGSLSLLQGIFPTQGSNPGLPHCGWILYQLSHKGSPRTLEWVAYPFSSGSFWPRNQTRVSCIADGFFTNWAISEPLGMPSWAFSSVIK